VAEPTSQVPVPVHRNRCVEQPPRVSAVIMIRVFMLVLSGCLANWRIHPRSIATRLLSYRILARVSFCFQLF
jgi:hypothetical protein